MSIIKTLSVVGNSLALIIDKPILELLNFGPQTQVELTTDGESLIVKPAKNRKERVANSISKIMKKHDATFRKLAK